jgi:hypothetical protein
MNEWMGGRNNLELGPTCSFINLGQANDSLFKGNSEKAYDWNEEEKEWRQRTVELGFDGNE